MVRWSAHSGNVGGCNTTYYLLAMLLTDGAVCSQRCGRLLLVNCQSIVHPPCPGLPMPWPPCKGLWFLFAVIIFSKHSKYWSLVVNCFNSKSIPPPMSSMQGPNYYTHNVHCILWLSRASALEGKAIIAELHDDIIALYQKSTTLCR